MGLFEFLRRNRKNISTLTNREHLLKNGRMCDGFVIDSEIDEEGREIIHYQYSIHGVDFESSEYLSEEMKEDPLKYAPGAGICVRFDPKNHHNSILV